MGRKVKLRGLPPIAILPSRAYPAARPETTALWYSALTSILPSVAGVVMVLFHIVGSGQAFNWVSRTLASERATFDAGLARKRMFSPAKTYASEPPARQAPMIHGIQLGSGRSSVRFASFGEADVPSLSAALTGGRNDSLAAEAVRAVAFAGRQRLYARPPPFVDPSSSIPFQHVLAPLAKLFLRAVSPILPAGSPPSA